MICEPIHFPLCFSLSHAWGSDLLAISITSLDLLEIKHDLSSQDFNYARNFAISVRKQIYPFQAIHYYLRSNAKVAYLSAQSSFCNYLEAKVGMNICNMFIKTQKIQSTPELLKILFLSKGLILL